MNPPSLLGTIYRNSPELHAQVKEFINRGADLNHVTKDGESALRVASNNARFDVVNLLLEAGADTIQLEWTDTIFKLVYGTQDELVAHLSSTGAKELEIVDAWSRTPLLIAFQMGDVAKADLLITHGADRLARGHCGKTPFQYAVEADSLPMLQWLFAQGFDLNETDQFGNTPVITAAALGRANCLRYLIQQGADIFKENHIPWRAITEATTLEVVRILVENGEDINEISPEMHAELIGVGHNQIPQVNKEDYLAAKTRCFGQHMAEETNFPFWLSMIRSGANSWQARTLFDNTELEENQPVWCYQRYGRTTTVMDDGRIIEIGGEHEDYYDPDFCIYNDVTVFDGKGGVKIFSYPQEIFPPTDFHTATLVGNYIYIIGSLSYSDLIKPDTTPVYRLDTKTYEISAVKTHGTMPGWLSRHKAQLTSDNKIGITGGKLIVANSEGDDYVDNAQSWQLCLNTFRWSAV